MNFIGGPVGQKGSELASVRRQVSDLFAATEIVNHRPRPPAEATATIDPPRPT